MRTIIREEKRITSDLEKVMSDTIINIEKLDTAIMSICKKIWFIPEWVWLIPNVRTAIKWMDILQIIETQKMLLLDFTALVSFIEQIEERI